jgi:hypothetical protein
MPDGGFVKLDPRPPCAEIDARFTDTGVFSKGSSLRTAQAAQCIPPIAKVTVVSGFSVLPCR